MLHLHLAILGWMGAMLSTDVSHSQHGWEPRSAQLISRAEQGLHSTECHLLSGTEHCGVEAQQTDVAGNVKLPTPDSKLESDRVRMKVCIDND